MLSISSRSPFIVWTLFVLLSSVVSRTNALLGFGDKRFNYEGLIDTGSLGLDHINGQVVAWGDWNGDQYLDVIVLDRSRTTLSVYIWDHTTFKFQSKPVATVSIPLSNNTKISNVIAADLNYDGRLDLLVMSQQGSATSDELSMGVYLGLIDGSGFNATPIHVPSSTLAQPFSIDATGDMQLDLLGQPFGSGSNNGMKLWRNLLADTNRTNPDAFDLVDAPFLTSGPVPNCNLVNPHSSAFIDLDGDCLADLFMVCSDDSSSDLRYQIWTAVKPDSSGKGSGFSLAASGRLPPGTGALSFGDMDRDGTIDVVFPSCDKDGSNCYINIAYNRQVPLCSLKSEGLFGGGLGSGVSTLSSRNDSHLEQTRRTTEGQRVELKCREPEDLCVADNKFRINFDIEHENSDLVRIPVEKLTGDSRVLTSDQLAPSSFFLPLALQLGDFNKDGYPDITLLTIPAKTSKGGANRLDGLGETRLHLLQNVACSSLPANERVKLGCRTDQQHGQTFVKVEEGAHVLETYTDVRSVSWVDVDEDGTLDLLLQRVPIASSSSDGSDASRRMTFVQNNYFHDSFFLKSLTLNGACHSFCDPPGHAKFRPWGTNYGGASYKFTVLDTNGVRRAQQVGQLPQTTYRSLLTPYSYFGLGRTNNYVESLFIGSTRRQQKHYLAVEGIIPNSQVVINPWEGGFDSTGSPRSGDPGMWTKQLYLHPGDWIPWVTIVLITAILGLAIVVMVLHVNERREDEKERKRAVHAINFDAL